MFIGSILAIDMGGCPLAAEMAENYQSAVFSGGILIVIAVALFITRKMKE